MTSHFKHIGMTAIIAATISIGAASASASEITGTISSDPQAVAGSQTAGTIAGSIGDSAPASSNGTGGSSVSTPRPGGSRRSISLATAYPDSAAYSTFNSFAGTVGGQQYTYPDYSDAEIALSAGGTSLAQADLTDTQTINEGQDTSNLAAIGALGNTGWGTWAMVLAGVAAISSIAYGVTKLVA